MLGIKLGLKGFVEFISEEILEIFKNENFGLNVSKKGPYDTEKSGVQRGLND